MNYEKLNQWSALAGWLLRVKSDCYKIGSGYFRKLSQPPFQKIAKLQNAKKRLLLTAS
jgi:hypothetical protein